ncbi:hypothetical protein IJH19_02620 [Candidatus Saccharibacteria bacterium]|nr:hypothetical protein [Candidatus Saccharibacteria bacterium]
MNQIKKKKIFLRMMMCLAVAILALSNVYVPKASAAESYFTAEGGTLNLDEIDPSEPDQRLVDIRLKATREMTIHSMHGYFTPISEDDEELNHYMSWMDYSSGISHLCYSTSTGEFDWNIPGCIDDVVSDEGIHVQAGDTLIYVTFEVKDDVEVMKRSMPVALDLAVIDDGTETGKQIRNITMDAYVRAGHDLSVYKYIMGNGDLNVPNIVVGGTDVEVEIVPEPGNELVYLELNDQEVTDQIRDNVFRVTPGTESLTFYANFHRVYPVLEGDGGEHIIGSEEPLVFKIDNDVTTFCGTGLLIIDDEYYDMSTDCEVDPDNQTIILSASFLNTLALGEHSFEAYFSEPESGSAKASFKIVEPKTDDDDEDEDTPVVPDTDGNKDVPVVPDASDNKDIPETYTNDDENVPVPNTGVFTNKGDGVEMINNFIPIAMLIGIVVATGILMKKAKRGQELDV